MPEWIPDQLSNAETQSNPSRRRFIKIVVGGSVLGAGIAMPTHWITPIVGTVVLPAHAQTSPPPSPPLPEPTGNIAITEILWRQTASNDPNILIDEYVEIENQDSVSIQLENWRLTDSGPATFTFPAHVMAPGETCRIYTHNPVPPNNTHPCQFTFGRTSPGSPGNYIWNNAGDTAFLYDSTTALVNSCGYSRGDPSPYRC